MRTEGTLNDWCTEVRVRGGCKDGQLLSRMILCVVHNQPYPVCRHLSELRLPNFWQHWERCALLFNEVRSMLVNSP